MENASCGSSLSKGVFVFKGTKKFIELEDYFPSKTNISGSESQPRSASKRNKTPRKDGDRNAEDDVLSRLKLFDETWETFSNKLKAIERCFNEDIISDVVKFIKLSETARTTSGDSVEKKFNAVSEITTAALVTGVNVTDHSALFTYLTNEMKRNVTRHVIRLCSIDCSSLQSLFHNLFIQLTADDSQQTMQDDSAESGDEDIVDASKQIGVKIKSRRKHVTMMSLLAWYREMYQNRDLSGRPSLVFIFEDFEGFQPNILQDFISICGHYIEELPVVLIFGIATSQSVIHQSLSYNISSLLSIETFSGPLSTNYLSLIIDQVLMTAELPFRLGGKTFDFLLDKFLYSDFSVQNFCSAFKFCMLEHYQKNSLSVLCVGSEKIKQRISSLNMQQLDKFRSCPSFRRYVEQSTADDQIRLLEDDDVMRAEILKLSHLINKYHMLLPTILKCLHVVSCDLPKYPLGNQLRELYALCLCVNMCETFEYQQAILLLRTLSRDKITSLLSQLLPLLSAGNVDVLELYCDKISKFIDRLNLLDLEGADAAVNVDASAVEVSDITDSTSEVSHTTRAQKLNIQTLKLKLQQQAQNAEKKTRTGAYDELRNKIVDYLDTQIFRKHLLPPQSLTLYELFYYDNVNNVRQNLSASPRTTIQQALNHPQLYINIQGGSSETEGISPYLPDLCIVYKLHLECGRLINLCDWMQAFKTVVTSAEDFEAEMKKCGDTKESVDKKMQARFIRAVSELQMLGFIKSTKRKTDHMARLTWGAC